MIDRHALDRLCAMYGIAPDYTDVWGKRHWVSMETKLALLSAMGIQVADEAEQRRALEECELRAWRRWLPPVQVVRQPFEEIVIHLSLPAAAAQTEFDWRFYLEGGRQEGGGFRPDDLERVEQREIRGVVFNRYSFKLALQPEIGYHWFELSGADKKTGMSLIVAPAGCYRPEAIQGNGRIWGPALQLYAVRSQRNWGIGDFSDLKAILEIAEHIGADIVGLNPLHALFPHNPEHASPYSPSSRFFYNVLYIDVEAVPDFAECIPAREAVADPQFQARLRALRASELVDYKEAAAAKFSTLELVYRHFRERHLSADSDYGRAFHGFRAEYGEELRTQALFEALQEHFFAEDSSIWGWPAWPEAYRDPASQAVADFAAAHIERIEFYEYLQWQTAMQLEAAGRRSWELGLGTGIYADLAVSIDGAGAEAWARQDLYALNARVGAPPDSFSPTGQDWGLPPQIPENLRESAYKPFIQMLRRNMRQAGALRIDHVMGLMRLYWVPVGNSPAEGAYVYYPFEDLLGVLALESQRNQCLVIGEDLGTVPPELRQALHGLGVLSYRLLYFEKEYEKNGDFIAPADYPDQALVAVTTHDLPTLSGFWHGLDVEARSRLDLFPSQEMRTQQVVERAQDQARLLVALEREDLLPPGLSVSPMSAPEMNPELVRAVYLYLARTPAKVMMFQFEDVFGSREQVNLPGTVDQYPNWRRKLPLNLEDWSADQRLKEFTEILRRERGVPERRVPSLPRRPITARIPDATYRWQFNREFTFNDAIRWIPYLSSLGVSHCYASPYLRARPGSMHGYDIIEHGAINPEIGSFEDFDRYIKTLRANGMGQILDMVPNHMGVGSDNDWWLDVLENGPASAYAAFFDIDWRPFKEELRGKVLLPILGDQYGAVLENGELQLRFDQASGAFSVFYYEHRFPIDLGAYPQILGHRLERLVSRLDPQDPQVLAYQSLVTALGHLPGRDITEPDKVAERNRDKEIHKRYLAELCERSPDILWFVEENVRELNGTPGESQTFDLLHNLLEAQAYRLSYWRVAADDINYRRFFDINDLAGLRMENPTAFEKTHRFVLDLIAADKLDGLRIDHPDGLFDPVGYFQQLQDCFVPAQQIEAGQSDKPLYVLVEKILESYERLPEDWPVHGTTGYDFTNSVNALFVDAAAEEAMDRIYADFIGRHIDFEELLYDKKKLIMRTALASELNVLANQLARIAQSDRHTRDFTLNGLRDALSEVVAFFPVYRTYITATQVSNEDQRYVDWALSLAKKHSQAADLSIFDFLREVLLTSASEGKPEAYRKAVLGFAMKFQQYTGPLMAKGLEDTSFYIYNRLSSLNEVGGDPRRFGISVAAFHYANQERVRRWPHAMLASSTHDSKRSEDVRARINVLSELTEEWERGLQRWSRLNAPKKRDVDGRSAPSKNDEYLLYQTLLGAWPLEEMNQQGVDVFCGRIENYMLKAVREAKVHSSWINQNADYEEAVRVFVRALLDDPQKNRFLADFLPLQKRCVCFGFFNSLSQTLLKLTAPGMPDVYQGAELWDFSLVDPDNRRPVDYERRANLLRELQEADAGPVEQRVAHAYGLLENLEDGCIKLFITWKTLSLRRAQPELFRDGDYVALEIQGAKSEHVCAFARRWQDREIIVVAPRLFVRLLQGGEIAYPLSDAVWEDSRIMMDGVAAGVYRNVFTGEVVAVRADDDAKLCLPMAGVLAHFPVALLERL